MPDLHDQIPTREKVLIIGAGPAGLAAAAALASPPQDTRAYFRGECIRRYGQSVAAASWDSVIFDIGRESLVRVPMLEPLRGTHAHVGDLLDRCGTAKELIEALNSAR